MPIEQEEHERLESECLYYEPPTPGRTQCRSLVWERPHSEAPGVQAHGVRAGEGQALEH